MRGLSYKSDEKDNHEQSKGYFIENFFYENSFYIGAALLPHNNRAKIKLDRVM